MWMGILPTYFFNGFCFNFYIFPGALRDPDQFPGEYLPYQLNFERTDFAVGNVRNLLISSGKAQAYFMNITISALANQPFIGERWIASSGVAKTFGN